MAPPDLRKKTECRDCDVGLPLTGDALFSPEYHLSLVEMEKLTRGFFRLHHHVLRLFGERKPMYFFNVYQVNDRGMLEILETEWSSVLSEAVSNVRRLRRFPKRFDLRAYRTP